MPVIRFTGQKERIIGVYEDYPIPIAEGPSPLWILNASSRPWIDILPDAFSGPRLVIARDKFGRVASQGPIQFPTPHLFVEVGGSLQITEIED